MKSYLLRCSAAAVLATAFTSTAAFAGQDPGVTDRPAGSTTAINPKPTVAEDLVYLKDIVALQTIRLDEAEEQIAKQAALIEAQARQLEAINRTVVAMGAQPQQYAAGGSSTYKIKSGDTLSSIARQNNVSLRAMADANNLKPPYALRAGATLQVPGAPAPTVQFAAASAQSAPAQPAPSQKPVQTAQAAPTPQPATSKAANTQTAAAPAGGAQRTQVAANTQPAPKKDEKRESGLPTEVGVRPEDENERPYLAIFSDVGGILTPRGTMYVEPAVDFTVASDNRFFFQGIEIVDAVLIGTIEATDTDRRALNESLTAKYGITNRFEIDARIPYVSRQDRISGVAIDDATTTVRDLDGSGLGDVEFGLHYQLNNGIKLPYMVANLRVKAPTGTGPFDVKRNPDNGVETELAVGSGSWTIEPSLTFILSSDPASLYANIGYQYNMPVSPNVVIVDSVRPISELPTDDMFMLSERFRSTLQEFDPGDAIRTSIGVGLSLNERLSMNFGYDQSFFLRSKNTSEVFRIAAQRENFVNAQGQTETRLVRDSSGSPILLDATTNLVFSESPSTTVGSFLFGGSYAVNNKLRINLSGAIGATAEAPDARLSLRAQYRLFD